MVSLNSFNIKKTSEEGNTMNFEVGPLPKGYGHTLGNMLRRILLSSIPGSAITAVKLDGALHEYASLDGVLDDVLKVLLSIKNVVVRSRVDEPVTLTLNVQGKAGAQVEVKASDIEKNSDVDIVNGDYVITKLDGKASFKAEFTINNGTGYIFPDQEVRKELGTLPIDATFSPVVLVSYDVAETRVGQETDLDQLNLSVETNGSINSLEAVNISVRLLNEMTSHLSQITKDLLDGKEAEILKSTTVKEEEVVVEDETTKKQLVVEDLNLSTRLTNALLRSGIDELTKLEGYTEEELASIKGMGKKSLDELIEVLKKYEIKVI
ncbi:MAG: DNA-directed RNA polymerase subunit alpha [Candidatus Dojkabacteria bacterium]|nr:DNA-directed RNA polymerase subunit alpha [Candidatus Dojkabacteria bacterium]MDQ7021834.1 DNA-directed RNA polymerase subunit alpha [Candidatus Dojkabacteria bacterium]